MKVHIAGYNVDTSILRELEEKTAKRADLTPEVISAAYARISRDPRPIDKIREDARHEVERSRASNSTIIFKMGHHSVAEHAVFNLDIIGVSRLIMEEVEKFRLCSYTEKSQRYTTLDKGFVVPDEVKGSSAEKKFLNTIKKQNRAYSDFFEKLKVFVFKKYPDLAREAKNTNLLEGWAKEDARYITALAAVSQVGETLNARNLELLLRRFASHPLSEVKKLGCMLYKKIAPVAPSIVIFHEANDYDAKTYPALKELAQDIAGHSFKRNVSPDTEKDARLVEFTKGGDDVIASSLMHVSGGLSYEECCALVKDMDQEKKRKIFMTAWQNAQFYDSMPREFEYVNLTFDVVVSSACFGQLKRHRMATITSQAYDPLLGVTIPVSIKEIGMEKKFMEIVEDTNETYEAIFRENPLAAPYVLTNAHRKRALIRLNARELYHISRLREDNHAQWDIRNLSCAMSLEAKKVMPLTFALIGGKDRYHEIYRSLYGHLPKITETILPGARKIV